MKSLETLLNEYSKDHQNVTNQKIHYICVPVIVYSILGLLWVLPQVSLFSVSVNFSWVFILGATIYYLLLDLKLALLMLLISLLMVFSFPFIAKLPLDALWVFIALFVVAWVGQFYGHKVEGKKPSFLTDLTYLFIGPLWIIKKLFL